MDKYENFETPIFRSKTIQSLRFSRFRPPKKKLEIRSKKDKEINKFHLEEFQSSTAQKGK